jgi:hypothetical protein
VCFEVNLGVGLTKGLRRHGSCSYTRGLWVRMVMLRDASSSLLDDMMRGRLSD